MKKLQASILLAGILLIAFTGFLNAQQMPGDPHAFYGEAKYSDGSLIDGLDIVAKINGNSFNDTLDQGEYDINVESSSGGTVEFYVNGTKVGDHKFEAFESTNKDFNTSISAPSSSGNNNGGNNNSGGDDSSGEDSDDGPSGGGGGSPSDDDSDDSSENNGDDGGTIQLTSDTSNSNSDSSSDTSGNENSGSDGAVTLNENTTTKKNESQSLFGITGAAIGTEISALNLLVLGIGLIFLIVGVVLVIKTSRK